MHELQLSIQQGDDAPAPPVDRRQLRRWVAAALERPAQLTLRFVDSEEGRQLNLAFRGRNYPTNVLTFPYGPSDSGQADTAADVVICMPVLTREARDQKKPLRDHLAHLVIHGVLHAQGYDHELPADAQRMEAREQLLLKRFRIADPY